MARAKVSSLLSDPANNRLRRPELVCHRHGGKICCRVRLWRRATSVTVAPPTPKITSCRKSDLAEKETEIQVSNDILLVLITHAAGGTNRALAVEPPPENCVGRSLHAWAASAPYSFIPDAVCPTVVRGIPNDRCSFHLQVPAWPVPNSFKWIFTLRPGPLSSRRNSPSCILMVAATRLRPNPLPVVVRLRSSR